MIISSRVCSPSRGSSRDIKIGWIKRERKQLIWLWLITCQPRSNEGFVRWWNSVSSEIRFVRVILDGSSIAFNSKWSFASIFCRPILVVNHTKARITHENTSIVSSSPSVCFQCATVTARGCSCRSARKLPSTPGKQLCLFDCWIYGWLVDTVQRVYNETCLPLSWSACVLLFSLSVNKLHNMVTN